MTVRCRQTSALSPLDGDELPPFTELAESAMGEAAALCDDCALVFEEQKGCESAGRPRSHAAASSVHAPSSYAPS